MDKIIIFYAHPDKEGLHGYILEELKNNLKEKKQEYEIIDLYEKKYDPILKYEELYSRGRRQIDKTTEYYQNLIKNNRLFVFIYPTWWQNMPAVLKGFFDRVFTGGFGFTYQHGLPVPMLKGKKAAVFSGSGGPRLYGYLIGNPSTKAVAKHLLAFCGFKTKRFHIWRANRLDDKKKEALKKIAGKISTYLQ